MEFTPYTLPLLASAAIAAALALFAVRYRDVPGRVTFALLMLAVTVWSVGYAAEISAAAVPAKVLWAKFQYLGIAAIPFLWLRFVVRFAGEAAWLTPRRSAALVVIPALTLVCVWFNESLGLVWRDIAVDQSLGFTMLVFRYGPGLWMFAAYSYLLLLFSALVLIRAIVWLPRLGSRQVTVVLTAALAPWAGNVLYLSGLNPFPLLDLTPFSFTFTGLVMAWGVGSFRFMGILPVAHRAIIDGMRDGVIAIDPDNNVIELNAAAERLFDVKSEDVLGKPVWTAFDGHPSVVEWLTTGREANERAVISVHGYEREFHIRILLLYDRRRHAGRLITFHDISQLALAERVAQDARELAEMANRSKSEFLANVSHEVRTPLNAILGMTNLTLQSDLGPQQKENLEIVRSSGESLLAIINDILDLSKIEARKLMLDAIRFDLNDTIGETMKMLSVSAAEKQLPLRCDIGPDVPTHVVGDALRLRQILFNLLSNAIKFTAEGEVRVVVTRDADAELGDGRVRLRFEVTDTGIGISEQDRARIFESFAQADASTTRLYGGTGLGLAIVSHLIELMEGSIEVESEPGKGSTFRFTAVLGVVGATAARAAEAVAPDGRAEIEAGDADSSAVEVPAPARRPLRILVAEDNAVNQRVARILLESQDHTVTLVGDGAEAIEALGAGPFDVVLMDVQMPNMDGIEATRAIRAGEKWTGAHIPIIAVTAHAMTGDEERFLEAGMDGYVPKPLEAERLFSTIHALASPSAVAVAVADEADAPIDSAARAADGVPVFVYEALLDRLVGDEDLLVEVVELYLQEYPPVMDSIRAALADGDAEAAWKGAHRLKGSVGSLSANAAYEVSRVLETAGREGDLVAAAAAFADLELEVERLADVLNPIVAG